MYALKTTLVTAISSLARGSPSPKTVSAEHPLQVLLDRPPPTMEDAPMNLHKFLVLGALLAALVIGAAFLASAQTPTPPPRFEVAMIKWDGPDKVQLITPNKNEFIRVFKNGTRLPPDIRDEEYCLTWAANKMAAEGWEPVNLNATRILLRRPVSR